MSRLGLFSAAVSAACLFAFFIPGVLPGILGALSLCALLLLPKGKEPRTRRLRWLAAGLCLGFFWSAAYSLFFFAPAQALEGRTIRLAATVQDFPRETIHGVAVTIKGNEAGASGVQMILYLDKSFQDLQPGDKLSCVAYCSSSAQSGRLYNRAKGIFLTARAYGTVQVTPVEGVPLSFAPLYLAKQLREQIQRFYPGEQAALLEGLLTGYTDNLSQETQNAFSRTGLSHVVSVSGMHVSFLAGFLLLLLGKNRKSTAILQILIIFFFAAMAGNAPGALRAAIFASVALLAPFFGRRSEAVTALFTALLLLLLLSPFSIARPGLQFSFAATLGIYLVSQPLQKRWTKNLTGMRKRLLTVPLSLVAVSIGVNLFTIPLTALYFGQASLISPFSNLLTHWAVAAGFLGGLLSTVLGTIWPALGEMLASVVGLPLRFFLWSAESFARLPFAALELQSVYYQFFLCFLYVLIFVYLLGWFRGFRRPILPICAGVLALCLSLLLTNLDARRSEFRLTVLDVGQGQSLALLADERRVLIDCGGKQAGATAASYFHALGYSSLDLLVLTHYHADHADGVAELIQRLDVARIALPDADWENPQRLEIETLALESGIEIWYIEEETLLTLGPYGDLRVFPPLSKEGDNEAGLSMLFRYGDWEALITGDMGAEGEETLIARYPMPDIEALILGHHGSKYSNSEALLEATTPDVALASVGLNNSYNHPAEETVLRLEEMDIPLYRTDLMGNLTLSP